MKIFLGSFWIFCLVAMQSFSAQNQCGDLERQKYLYPENHHFVDVWTQCGSDSWGASPETAQCLMKEFPEMTQGCATCFGNYAACIRSECWFACMWGRNASCEQCAGDNCADNLWACTGISKSQMPQNGTN